MNALSTWFERQLEREDRTVCLEDALLVGRFAAYVKYRLQFFLGRTLIAGILHLVEFLLLYRALSSELFFSALLFRLAISIVSSWWWGGLEVMRNEVRSLRDESSTHRIPLYLAPWLFASFVYAFGTLSATAGWIVLDLLRSSAEFSVFHLYVLALGIRLSVSFVARTFHSGLYAVRRIYRPFFSTIASDLFAFGGTLVLWPLVGAWALPTMLILSGLLVNALTFVFTSRAYRLAGTYPACPRWDHTSLAVFRRTMSRPFHAAGFANAFVHLDSMLVLSMFPLTGTDSAGATLFLVMYCIGPFLRAGREWAQLLYFDLKRLNGELLGGFKRNFERSALKTSLFIATLMWLLSIAAATWALQKNLGFLYGVLLPFLLVCSRLAVFQVRAFTQQRFVSLMSCALGLSCLLAVMRTSNMGGEARLMLLTALLLGTSVCLQIINWLPRASTARCGLLPLTVWLDSLRQVDQRLRFRSVRFAYDVNDATIESAAREISRRLDGHGQVTIGGRKQITWYELESAVQPPADKWLIRLGAGLIERMETTAEFENSTTAIDAEAFVEVLDPSLNWKLPVVSQPIPAEQIRRMFEELFPTGICHAVANRSAAPFRILSSTERREVMIGALEFARSPFKTGRPSELDVTTLCIGKEIRHIFCVHRSENRRLRDFWRLWITQFNMTAAVDPLTTLVEETQMKNRFFRPMRVAVMAATCLATALTTIEIDDSVQAPFEVQSSKRSELCAPVDGWLNAVYIDEGDTAEKGMVVARMESPELTRQIAQTRGLLQEANAQRDLLAAGTRAEEIAAQRRRIVEATDIRDVAKRTLESDSHALKMDLARLDQLIYERLAELNYSRQALRRVELLHARKATSADEVAEAKSVYNVALAKWRQADAEKKSRKASGTSKAKADLARAESELVESRLTLDLMLAGTRSEELQAAEAVVLRLEQELHHLESLQSQNSLTSPVKGVLTSPGIQSLVGSYIKQGDVICEIARPKELECRITLSDAEMNRVQVGQSAMLKVRALPYRTFRGDVSHVSTVAQAPAFDSHNQTTMRASFRPGNGSQNTFSATCRLANNETELCAGMTGYARLSLGRKSLAEILVDRVLRVVRTEFWW